MQHKDILRYFIKIFYHKNNQGSLNYHSDNAVANATQYDLVEDIVSIIPFIL